MRSHRGAQTLFRNMDRCCSPGGGLPSRSRILRTDSRLSSLTLHLKIHQVVWLAMATTGPSCGRSLVGRKRNAGDGLERRSDHTFGIHYAERLCAWIVPHNVPRSPSALMHMSWLRNHPERIRHLFVRSRTSCSEVGAVFRVVQMQLSRIQESARVGHDPKAGSYHSRLHSRLFLIVCPLLQLWMLALASWLPADRMLLVCKEIPMLSYRHYTLLVLPRVPEHRP